MAKTDNVQEYSRHVKVRVGVDERDIFTKEYSQLIAKYKDVRIYSHNAERVRDEETFSWVPNNKWNSREPLKLSLYGRNEKQVVGFYRELKEFVKRVESGYDFFEEFEDSKNTSQSSAEHSTSTSVSSDSSRPYVISARLPEGSTDIHKDSVLSGTLSKPAMQEVIYYHVRDGMYLFECSELKTLQVLYTVLELCQCAPSPVKSRYHPEYK